VVAILLVGGGVTAAVVASGGGTGDSQGETTDEVVAAADKPGAPKPGAPKPGETEPGETKPAETKEPEPAETRRAETTPAETTPAETTPAETKPAETKPAETKQTPLLGDLAEAKEDLDDLKDSLEELKNLGGTAGIDVRNGVAGGTAPSTGWFTRHEVQPPSWNPKKVDVDRFIDWAIAEAKRNVPDARLTRIDVEGVYPSGFADLVQVDGTIDLRFVSPSRTGRPKNVPRGVKVAGRECEFRIMAGADDAEIYDMSSFNECKSVAIPRPRCSIKQVWAKVRAKHKDIDDAVAQITYMTNIVSHKIVWSFRIDDDPDISEMFADDC
jgi:hypothetical protein